MDFGEGMWVDRLDPVTHNEHHLVCLSLFFFFSFFNYFFSLTKL